MSESDISMILGACAANGIGLVRQRAYVLATVEHETDGTMRPINEYGDEDYFNRRYGPRTTAGRSLGNIKPGDGAMYHGRGYVQITGRANYTKFAKLTGLELVRNPDLALIPSTAAFILCYGFKHGTFTGRRLGDYITPTRCDYINARRCINGTDKAARIAEMAEKWEQTLTDAG